MVRQPVLTDFLHVAAVICHAVEEFVPESQNGWMADATARKGLNVTGAMPIGIPAAGDL